MLGLLAGFFRIEAPPGDVVYGSAEFFSRFFTGNAGHPMTKKKAMKTKQLDLLPINPGGCDKVYQDPGTAEYGP